MDYREQTSTALSWRRARQVVISNERGITPAITFAEEDVVIAGEKEFRTAASGADMVTGTFDPAGVIALLNPETGEPLGTSVTQAELYVILHSLYIQLASARDAALEPPPEGNP